MERRETSEQEHLDAGVDRRLNALIRKSSDIFAIVGPDATVQYVSPAVEPIMGYAPSELIGRVGFELIHPDDIEASSDKLNSILANPGGTAQLELRARHKDGSWRWLDVHLQNLLHDPDIEGLIINQRDITDRKGLEEQLRESQKLEAVGRLAGEIAHDFGNIIAVVRGMADALARSLPESKRELTDALIKASERGGRLTRELLAFSRRSQFHPEELLISEAILNIESLLKVRLGARIELVTELPQNLGKVALDGSEFEQMLLNLAANARDAMPEGGRFRLACRNINLDEETQPAALPPGRYVMMSASDDGIGMSPEVRDQIFEPFFTTKPRGRGTGLGLSSTYATVTKAGGAIVVASAPGEGTTFDVYLPTLESDGES